MFPWLVAVLLIVLVLVIFKYSKVEAAYWKKKGVHCPKPVPIFGNFSEVCFFQKTVGDWLQNLYDIVHLDYFGIYIFDQPALVLKSPELIRRVLIQDSVNFINKTLAEPNHDEALSNLMFLQKDERWKAFRSRMTPVFSSKKIKALLPTLDSECRKMKAYLVRNTGILECKGICEKLMTNILARCVFGVDAHSFEEEDAEFRRISKVMFGFSWRNAVVQSMYFFMPRWAEWLRLHFIEKSIMDYLHRVYFESVKARKKYGFNKMNDLIDIIHEMESKKNSNEDIDIDSFKAAAFAVQFFFAGFETTISTISFTLHELCLNLNVQDKLRAEILASISKHRGITYDSLLEMKYLDMCIHETLRKYPVLPFLDRACNEDYTFPGSNLTVEKGTPIYVPLRAMHMDEQYFSEPQKFEPERFINRKYNEHGLVYLPFGAGPRNCIGERFGLISTKLALVHILSQFHVEKCTATPDPVVFDPKSVMLQSKVGLPMTLRLI
ncbi:unnamed protein product [Phaedon cochleariae]|uniref:Cytochrome P450 n=1 Tax=Phaedon cochleariae TaxID=80249 RepID=A0A9P0GI53_PHACE|nr:unnamed protein product [Phaedon cochleariae]